MNKPNFFIIGAPKCGTTALSKYLKDNPQIYFSEPKEAHYFTSDNDQRTEFIRINENKSHKLGALGNFSEKPPALIIA